MSQITTAGNRGQGVGSDCYVELELVDSGGLQIEVKSKVMVLFGRKIEALCRQVLEHFEIENAKLYIEDTGALDYIIAARVEAAIRKQVETDKEFLLEQLPQNKVATEAGRNRRSRLYLPGNSPKLALNAGVYGADAIILDLEDAVAVDRKFEAAILVRNALRSVDFYGAERMVRINQLPRGLDDLDFVIPHYVNLLLVPKCESAAQIAQLNARIKEIAAASNMDNTVHLMPILESAKGIMNAQEIANSENVVALAIGLEDYTADLGVQAYREGGGIFLRSLSADQRCQCRRNPGIDSVFSDVSDMDALAANVQESKSLGFTGMGCIHPRQVPVVHENYAPDDAEIEKAKQIVNAFIIATEKGLGVVSLGSKMIDPPVVIRAQTTIDMAIDVGKLDENWRNEYVG